MMLRRISRRFLVAVALLGIFAASSARAQWGGREHELVIYAFSKNAIDLRIVPGSFTNTGQLTIRDPLTLPVSSFGPGFPAKQLRVLHNEPGDFFAYVTQVEGISSPRQLRQQPGKILYLNGMFRDPNPGSVSQAPLDVTGGLYFPLIPGVAAGPDVALDESHSLLWTPSASSPPYVAVPLETKSSIGPPGLTGVELEAVAGVAPFFVPWENLRRRYPQDAWPDGMDVKVFDQDPLLGNTAMLIRLRPGKVTPLFIFTGNTHLFVLQGDAQLQPGNGLPTVFPLNSYTFVPKDFALRIANPRVFALPLQKESLLAQ
jgi:hypothetical protein